MKIWQLFILDVARCDDLLVDYDVWGRPAKGVDLSRWVTDLKWLGCNGVGCSTSSFFCTSTLSGSISFGTTNSLPLRAVLGKTIPTFFTGCASSSGDNGILNAPVDSNDARILCEQLGYTSGSVGSSNANWEILNLYTKV